MSWTIENTWFSEGTKCTMLLPKSDYLTLLIIEKATQTIYIVDSCQHKVYVLDSTRPIDG